MVWAIGQQLQNGKYRIEQVLGQGGFGITYKALHLQLGQQVVIKTPNESLSRDPDYDKYVERFIKEGRLLARLSEEPHPNIVGVIDLFQEGEIHCLVMDYIAGENLFDIVRRRGALPEAEVLECFRQIGEALTVVHQAGLVHRDAHPGNIMLRRNGKAILIDFGIAGELVPTTVSSKHFANIGFAPYEQMNGDRNPTVDVYCLTATLYFAVTGKKPPTSLDRKLYAVRLIPPKEIVPSISDKLNKAILKGMALEAKNRPQTMEALLNFLEVSQVVTISLPLTEKIQPSLFSLFKRYSWPILGISGILLVSVIAKVFYSFPNYLLPQNSVMPSPISVHLSPKPNSSPSITPSITQKEAVSLIKKYLVAKNIMVAPPFDPQLVAEFTTGEKYNELTGTEGVINWLQRNNAYYKYGIQRIDGVQEFVSNGDNVIIQLKLAEEIMLYENGAIRENTSQISTVRYTLGLEDGRWKIASQKTIH